MLARLLPRRRNIRCGFCYHPQQHIGIPKFRPLNEVIRHKTATCMSSQGRAYEGFAPRKLVALRQQARPARRRGSWSTAWRARALARTALRRASQARPVRPMRRPARPRLQSSRACAAARLARPPPLDHVVSAHVLSASPSLRTVDTAPAVKMPQTCTARTTLKFYIIHIHV